MQAIAQELGVSNAKSLSKEDLIYRILDEQAFRNSQSGAPAVVKEENRMNRRNHRRNRITQEAGSKVYTATGDKAVKLDKSDVKRNQQKVEKETAEEKTIIAAEKVQEPVREVVEAKVVETPAVETPAAAEPRKEDAQPEKNSPKKRGRKPKNKQGEQQTAEVAEAPAVEVAAIEEAPVVEAPVAETQPEQPAPKKRGRKPKNTQPEQPAAEASAEDAPAEEVFIPIEDLPVDNGEAPAELINKFVKKE